MTSDAFREHPLLPQLEAIFSALATSDWGHGVDQLHALIEEEGQNLLHRSNPVNAQSQVLAHWIAENLRHLTKVEERTGLIRAIDVLRSVEYCDVTIRTTLFSKLLCDTIKEAEANEELALEAAKVWGRLLTNDCSYVDLIAENEAAQALERLEKGPSGKRFVSCVILLQIAERISTHIVSRTDEIFHLVWYALRDKALRTRKLAAVLFRRLLSLAPHSSIGHGRWVEDVLAIIQRHLLTKSVEAVHGGLLGFSAFLRWRCEEDVRVEMSFARFEELAEFVAGSLNKLHQMNSIVRDELFGVLPSMAQFDPHVFAERFLSDVVSTALQMIRTSQDDCRAHAFLMLGNVGKFLGLKLRPYTSRIIKVIDQNLVSSKRPKRERCPSAATCLAMLATADAVTVRPFVLPMLDALFACPPSPEFSDDISMLCTALPEIHSLCVERMLGLVKTQMRSSPKETGDSERITNALSAVEHLQFRGDALLRFVAEELLDFLVHRNPAIRKLSLRLCGLLMFSSCHAPGSRCACDASGAMIHEGQCHTGLVMSVQKQIVNMAIADPDPEMRHLALEFFTDKCDATLAATEVVHVLLPVLNDKHTIRLAGVRILGRLALRNPASIVPALRSMMAQCLADIKYFTNPKTQEKAFAILALLTDVAPLVIRPYSRALLALTLKALEEQVRSEIVATAALATLEKLVRCADMYGDVFPNIFRLKDIVVPHVLGATSPQKRQAAIRALGSIVRITHDTLIYEEVPALLPFLLSMLHGGFKQSWSMRNDVIILLGIVGAVDPARIKHLEMQSILPAAHDAVISRTKGEEAIFQTVVAALLETLEEHTANDEICSHTVTALVRILTSRAMKLPVVVRFLPRVFPALLQQIGREEQAFRSKLFRELTNLVSVLRHHVRAYVEEVLVPIRKYILVDRSVLSEALRLLVQLRQSLNEEFRPYLPELLPLLVKASCDTTVAPQVFATFGQFGRILDGHLHVVLPCVLDYIVSTTEGTESRVHAANTLSTLARILITVPEHAARCIHSLCRVLAEGEAKSTDSVLKDACLAALCSIVEALGEGFMKFAQVVRPQVLACFGANSSQYVAFCSAVSQAAEGGKPISAQYVISTDDVRAPRPQQAQPTFDPTFSLVLKQVSFVNFTDDAAWKQWLRQFTLESLRSSPSLALQVCTVLAQAHEPFARRVFYSAFTSCYNEMDEISQLEVVKQLGVVLNRDPVPSEVLQEILNLAEYMERNDALQRISQKNVGLFDTQLLAQRSESCKLHAKALHYVEAMFLDLTRDFESSQVSGRYTPLDPDRWKLFLNVCEHMMHLYNALSLRASSNGVLTFVQNNYVRLAPERDNATLRNVVASMYEQLEWWQESYYAYRDRHLADRHDARNILGMIRALDALGQFRSAWSLWSSFSKTLAKRDRDLVAPFAARAAWMLQDWSSLQGVTAHLTDVSNRAVMHFYRGLCSLYRNEDAREEISLCRRCLDGEVSALFAESYERCYKHCVSLQQVCELEEVIAFRKGPKDENRRKKLRDLWMKRMRCMRRESIDWQGTLNNHQFVFQKEEELPLWLEFVTICRQSDRNAMAKEVLDDLLGHVDVRKILENGGEMPQPQVVLAVIEHEYGTRHIGVALDLQKKYIAALSKGESLAHGTEQILSSCHLRLGEQIAELHKDTAYSDSLTSSEILSHFRSAVELEPASAKAWHAYALANQQCARHCERSAIDVYVNAALDGFINVIKLSPVELFLQDALGFLSAWFTHGGRHSVAKKVAEIIDSAPVNTWLSVVPQLIARLDAPCESIARLVQELLCFVAKQHPQALLFPLNVALNDAVAGSFSGASKNRSRKFSAKRVLGEIAISHGHEGKRVVGEAEMTCSELVRIAILRVEWLRALLDHWNQEWNAHQSIASLRDMILEFREYVNHCDTPSEEQFKQEYGHDIAEIANIACDLAASNPPLDLEPLWNVFRKLSMKIDKNVLPNVSTLEMAFVSPVLVERGAQLSLVVPGQYRAGKPSPRIQSFVPSLKVLSSKQHPRILTIIGDDGAAYKFLLKGHEDLRLDERVMQLIGLVNTVLELHPETAKHDLEIARYSVTPLSDNVGLIGWVDHCATLFDMLKDYRLVHHLHINKELNQIRQLTDTIESLMTIQRVEVLEVAQEDSDGMDIARYMWECAPNAELWLVRRTNYIRTLATMSMVGHILGLGDRHMQNLMMHEYTGRIVHIDFGDCFEVTQKRLHYPEKWPFRLTRMLVKAMEVAGIQGLFQQTCEAVMKVLRIEKDSVMSVLEAFIYDPLISWRLDEQKVFDVDALRKADTIIVQDAVQHESIPMTSINASSIIGIGARIRSTDEALGSRQTAKSTEAIERIRDKLNGMEFCGGPQRTRKKTDESHSQDASKSISVKEQVSRLIAQATSNENLSHAYLGFCAFW